MRPPKPHWLSPGSKTWSPDVVISFDTETTEYPDGDDLRHMLACWDAIVDLRHDIAPTRARRSTHCGSEPGRLCDLIEAYGDVANETWVFAHNLNFDLTVTQLPAMLAHRKWTIEAYGMSKESNWWVFKRDGKKIVIADSWSWLPASLAVNAKDVGRRKRPLPGTGDTLETWHKRCKKDAEILAELVLTLMNWWDKQALGRWSITGAGCGWQAMRTLTGAKRIVVGPDGERTDFERSAIYGGRKEVFQIGQFEGEWCADFDFVGAYPTVVAHFPLPCTPGKPFITLPKGLIPGETPGKDVIARCQVTTDRPCAPVRIDHEVWYPTGTFATVLTGPEISYARSVGATVIIANGYVYKTSFALRPWALWVLALLRSNHEQHPPLVRRMAKGWSRSVIGRFAGHSSRITSVSPNFGAGWRLETGHNLDTGRPLEILHIGAQSITTEHDLDGADCFPAVLAFVEAHCRVALSQMLDRRTPDRVLQCNTDGWWERRVVRSAAYELERVPEPFQVVRKACTNSTRIIGPDHTITATDRHLAGVSTAAAGSVETGWNWHDWPGLRWQLEREADGDYVRPARQLDLRAHYARRWVLTTGETVPVETSIDTTGTNTIHNWGTTSVRRHADELATYQDARLSVLRSLDGAHPPIFEGSGPVLLGRSRWHSRSHKR